MKNVYNIICGEEMCYAAILIFATSETLEISIPGC